MRKQPHHFRQSDASFFREQRIIWEAGGAEGTPDTIPADAKSNEEPVEAKKPEDTEKRLAKTTEWLRSTQSGLNREKAEKTNLGEMIKNALLDGGIQKNEISEIWEKAYASLKAVGELSEEDLKLFQLYRPNDEAVLLKMAQDAGLITIGEILKISRNPTKENKKRKEK